MDQKKTTSRFAQRIANVNAKLRARKLGVTLFTVRGAKVGRQPDGKFVSLGARA